MEEHFPQHNWPILIVLLQIIRCSSFVMFMPSIYQFITSPRELPEEVEDNEVIFVLNIVVREAQSLFIAKNQQNFNMSKLIVYTTIVP